MRLRFLLIFILSVFYGYISDLSAQDVQKNGEYDVFLLIGQSNMAGRGHMIDGDEEIIDENVFILDEKGEVVPARNPLNIYSSIRKNDTAQVSDLLRRLQPGQVGRFCLLSMHVEVQRFLSGQKAAQEKVIMKRQSEGPDRLCNMVHLRRFSGIRDVVIPERRMSIWRN